jgi:hypothetical protein
MKQYFYPAPYVKKTEVWLLSRQKPVSRDIHLLTTVDRTVRWPEMLFLKSIAAWDCADTLVAIFVSHFQVVEDLTSDHGPQFASKVRTALCQRLGIKDQLTTGFHPQANGLVQVPPPAQICP